MLYVYLPYRKETPKKAAFTGSMQLLAGVKLCTGRPITNHPHYEDKSLRAKTKDVCTFTFPELFTHFFQVIVMEFSIEKCADVFISSEQNYVQEILCVHNYTYTLRIAGV